MSFHQRDAFGTLKSPGVAYAYFRMAKVEGKVAKTRTWAQEQAAYRKRRRKDYQAKVSRRKNRHR